MDLSHDHATVFASELEAFAPHGPVLIDRADEAASLSALWTELVNGLCKIEDCVFTAQTCALVVSRNHRSGTTGTSPVARLSKRHAEILERSLMEGARKSLAIDLGLCPSSVAEILKQGFTFMGLSCWPSRIPLLLVMAAHAKRFSEWDRSAALIVADNQRFTRQTIRFSRPDSVLSTRLSPAECAVACLLVEGKSYAEMALLRQTSVRTVANQLAAAFHRFGISGRAELLCLLAKCCTETWRASLGRSRAGRRNPGDAAASFLRAAAGAGGC
jgi:DNA-binding CsgD family transcriptional regulator